MNVSCSSIKQRQQSLLSKLICRRSTSTYVYVYLQYKDLTNESAKETFTAWTDVDTIPIRDGHRCRSTSAATLNHETRGKS